VKKDNIIGRKFGLLTVIESMSPTPAGHSRWLCECECGNKVSRTSTSMKRSRYSSCGCWAPRGSDNKLFTGVGEISGAWFWSVVCRSAFGRKSKSGIKKKIDIDIQYIWDLFLKQDRKCALSGVDLSFPKTNSKQDIKESTASLDRIDSSLGYVKGNVQWVHKKINIMKNTMTDEYFIEMCSLVHKNRCAGGACEVQ
jgi:hypothetical protein